MSRRTSITCTEPGCPELQPCSTHARTAWAGSTRNKRLPKNWGRIRLQVLLQAGRRCYLCGGNATEVDHIKPGDDHTITNLAAICTPCHRSKSAKEGNDARNR